MLFEPYANRTAAFLPYLCTADKQIGMIL